MRIPDKFFVGLLLVLAFSGIVLLDHLVTPAPSFQNAYKISQEISDCVVRIEDHEGGYGSGVVIRQADTAMILTAFHVIDGAKTLKVSHRDSMTGALLQTDGKVVRVDRVHDLALVETKPIWPGSALLVTYEQYDGDLTSFQECLQAGYPLLTETVHISYGLICNLDDHGRLRTSAPIVYGNSGGGVFAKIDGKWRLIGILQAVRLVDGDRSHPVPHINYSASPLWVLRFVGEK